MTSTDETIARPGTSIGLPGGVIVARIRRVLIVTLAAALIYPVFMSAGKATCAGGIDGDGGFIDAAGRPVDTAPACLQLTLNPSPLIYIAVAVIVLLAISRVIMARSEAAALRILDHAAIAIVVLVVVAIVVSQVWFRLIPIDQFTPDSFTVLSPFPFGSIETSVTSPTTP